MAARECGPKVEKFRPWSAGQSSWTPGFNECTMTQGRKVSTLVGRTIQLDTGLQRVTVHGDCRDQRQRFFSRESAAARDRWPSTQTPSWGSRRRTRSTPAPNRSRAASPRAGWGRRTLPAARPCVEIWFEETCAKRGSKQFQCETSCNEVEVSQADF